MCVCPVVLALSSSSSVVVARRCCLSFGRCCLSWSFVVVVGCCCLSLSFVVVVLPLSLSSWSVRPCLVFVFGRCCCRGPWTLVFLHMISHLLRKLLKMPLRRCMCPSGPHRLSVSRCQDQQMMFMTRLLFLDLNALIFSLAQEQRGLGWRSKPVLSSRLMLLMLY